ncbi:MAG: hypothetical protein H6863_03395 [Rhodospirillales bacterium]|nr:hypothetical protein [Rhodospirillales bacterium]MCB9980169.1 hypothetical protein [Rhodospirillales bacterium]
MSYLWLLVYLLFVIFILTFFFWNTVILFRQKQAWQNFAKKHNLLYRKGRLLEASAVEGNYKKNRIGLFSEGRADESSRGILRYRTVIEVVMGHRMPCTGALGNVDSMRIIESLNFGTTFHPEGAHWDKNHLITCADRDFIKEYLTPKRLERLNSFFAMKNAAAMMVFDKQDAFLRIETPDPMTDPQKIQALMDKLVVLNEELKLTDAEEKKWVPSKI